MWCGYRHTQTKTALTFSPGSTKPKRWKNQRRISLASAVFNIFLPLTCLGCRLAVKLLNTVAGGDVNGLGRLVGRFPVYPLSAASMFCF